jgi:serine/threonine protein kinase
MRDGLEAYATAPSPSSPAMPPLDHFRARTDTLWLRRAMGAAMAFQHQIFISYAREDRERVRPLVDILTSCGWYVWWDDRIRAGEDFQPVTTSALDSARAVIVVWSKDAVKSRWVRGEAERGLARNILVPVQFDNTSIPVAYSMIQTADLSDWRGERDHPELVKLIRDLGELAGSAAELGRRIAEHSKPRMTPEAADTHALAPGVAVGGYRIEGILGEGGFGITYLAEQAAMRQRVAIKEYLPTSFARRSVDGATVKPLSTKTDESFKWGLDRFRVEAQTLAKLSHPNIVRVMNFFEANGTAYMVMEYKDGCSLEDLLKPNKKLENFEILEILPGLLSGLDAVHKANFLHRDIKPANIFILGSGEAMLLDFGAAREAIALRSHTISMVRTEGYAPPEQYDSGAKLGPWSDLYALGATLYRCISGHPPADAPARVNAIMKKQPDPAADLLTSARGAYDKKLCAAAMVALAVREKKRPQSVAEFRQVAEVAHRPFTGPAHKGRRSTSDEGDGQKVVTKLDREKWGTTLKGLGITAAVTLGLSIILPPLLVLTVPVWLAIGVVLFLASRGTGWACGFANWIGTPFAGSATKRRRPRA